MNLYNIADNIRELARMAEQEDCDIDEQSIADTMEGLEGDLEYKADQLAKWVKNLTRQADMCELEARRLGDRSSKLRKTAESVTAYLHACMKIAGTKKIDNDLFKIHIRKTPDVIELDEELLPKKWFVERVEQRPDRRGILAAVKAGETIRGATLVTNREKLYIR